MFYKFKETMIYADVGLHDAQAYPEFFPDSRNRFAINLAR